MSVNPAAETPYGSSQFPVISGNGRYIAFWSTAQLVPEDTSLNTGDLYVRDRKAKTFTRILATNKNGDLGYMDIDRDGDRIVFGIDRPLLPGDTDTSGDVYLIERATGQCRR